VSSAVENIDIKDSRKVNPFLAFLAGLFGFGMGYVYVGRLRAGLVAFFGIYALIGIFSWSRLVVHFALVWWVVCVAAVAWIVITVIHPVVLAVRHRYVPVQWYKHWLLYVVWIVIGTTVALSITTNRATLFGYEPFRVPSASMSPTVEGGDFVMADTWRYVSHAPVVGEIVIVEKPYSSVKYIKRVVGVAGDSVEIRDGVIYRNGFAIDEPYLHAPMLLAASPRNVPAWTLGPGLIYLLGDYRDNSLDSRHWGPLPTSSLRGRVQYIWLSIDQEGGFRWSRVGTRLRP
jgi:signal peptidase I